MVVALVYHDGRFATLHKGDEVLSTTKVTTVTKSASYSTTRLSPALRTGTRKLINNPPRSPVVFR
jgi:hypothetical protein